MNKMAVTCDKCGYRFKIPKTKKKRFLGPKEGKVFVHYFNCPECLTKYPYYIETDKVNEIIQKKKKLQKANKVEKDNDQITDNLKEMDHLNRIGRIEQELLKKHFTLDD